MGFSCSVRLRSAFPLVALALCLSAGSASARLPDVFPVLSLRTVDAIHRPTGCAAKLEFDGRALLGARIVDPLCLSEDEAAQPVPAVKRHFHVPAPHRYLLRGR